MENLKPLTEKLLNLLKQNLSTVILGVVALLSGGIFYYLSQPKAPTQASSSILTSVTAHKKAVSSHSFEKTSDSISQSQNGQNAGIEVDLKGAVKRPGVYQMSADSRVNDLIQQAGGFAAQADQNTVNLAAKLKDEEVVYVAKIGEKSNPVATSTTTGTTTNSDNATGPDSPETSSENEKVNLNTADLTQLQTLSGIGAKKAQDIIDYRTQNGPFQSIDDLNKVSGFGDKTLAKLKNFVTVN